MLIALHAAFSPYLRTAYPCAPLLPAAFRAEDAARASHAQVRSGPKDSAGTPVGAAPTARIPSPERKGGQGGACPAGPHR